MGDDARDAAAICRRVLLQGGGGTQGDGGCWVVPGTTTSSGSSSSSLFSSTSGLTEDDDQGDDDDDATSSSGPLGRRPVSSSSSSSSLMSSDKMQMDMDGAAVAGPLYELSTMLEHLPSLRTGLSTYYRGRSQSFTSLADVSCVDDLAKTTTPYIRRKAKAPRCYAAALAVKNQLSRKIAKKQVQSSPDSLLLSSSKARNSCAAATDHLRATMALATERCTDASSWRRKM